MTLYAKVNGVWKPSTKLYAKKDGVWVLVYGGTLAVKSGTSLSAARSHLTSFVNNGRGYVCGGYNGGSYYSRVEYYDANGNLTSGTYLSQGRCDMTSFVNTGKAYVCGGEISGGYSKVVDVYDASGNRTTGTALFTARSRLASFVLNGKGYVCGGRYGSTAYINSVDVYDTSGNQTSGNALSVNTSYATSFVNNNKAYVCGGEYFDTISTKADAYHSAVTVYDTSGNRTTGNALSSARACSTSFVLGGKGYVCGGYNGSILATVDIYDASGNRTTGTSLPQTVYHSTSFVIDGCGYVCGGRVRTNTVATISSMKKVYVYDMAGSVTTLGTELSNSRHCATSFVLNGKGYVCGGVSEITQVLPQPTGSVTTPTYYANTDVLDYA